MFVHCLLKCVNGPPPPTPTILSSCCLFSLFWSETTLFLSTNKATAQARVFPLIVHFFSRRVIKHFDSEEGRRKSIKLVRKFGISATRLNRTCFSDVWTEVWSTEMWINEKGLGKSAFEKKFIEKYFPDRRKAINLQLTSLSINLSRINPMVIRRSFTSLKLASINLMSLISLVLPFDCAISANINVRSPKFCLEYQLGFTIDECRPLNIKLRDSKA